MMPGITVVIPTIPPREVLLRRALDSVAGATARMGQMYGSMVPVDSIVVQDLARNGAAKTRHQGLLAVDTEWVAFLDDDDVMHPNHLTELMSAALLFNADYLWSRFQIIKEDHVWQLCGGDFACNSPYPHGEFEGRPAHLRPRSQTIQGPVFLGEKAFSQWNDDDPCQTTITTLVRTELALAAGGFEQFTDDGSTVDGNRRGEDHEFTLKCRKAGGAFRHVPRVTWDWYHHSANTSGMPVW